MNLIVQDDMEIHLELLQFTPRALHVQPPQEVECDGETCREIRLEGVSLSPCILSQLHPIWYLAGWEPALKTGSPTLSCQR